MYRRKLSRWLGHSYRYLTIYGIYTHNTHILYILLCGPCTTYRCLYPQFRTTTVRRQKVKFCCAVWHGIIIIIFRRGSHKYGTAVTIAVCVCVCLQSVRWVYSAAVEMLLKLTSRCKNCVSASENTMGWWKNDSMEWTTDRLNKVTRSVLSLSSDLYCQIRGKECVSYFSSPSLTKQVIRIKHTGSCVFCFVTSEYFIDSTAQLNMTLYM